jgi:hypothetical protein
VGSSDKPLLSSAVILKVQMFKFSILLNKTSILSHILVKTYYVTEMSNGVIVSVWGILSLLAGSTLESEKDYNK